MIFVSQSAPSRAPTHRGFSCALSLFLALIFFFFFLKEYESVAPLRRLKYDFFVTGVALHLRICLETVTFNFGTFGERA